MSCIRLTQFMARAAGLYPDREAIRFGTRRSTWSSFCATTEELAGGLRRLGVRPTDRIAILAHNSDRYVEMLFAAWRISAAVVPLNTRWSADELSYALRDCTPTLLVVDDAFAPMTPSLPMGSDVRHLVHVGDAQCPAGAVTYAALRAGADHIRDLGAGGDAMAGIFYTGGTTGRPRGVMLSHTSIIATLLAGTTSRDKAAQGSAILCVLPLFHMAGVQLSIAAAMAAVPFIVHPQFDVESVLQAIEADRIEALTLVPAMWGMLLSHPRARSADLSSLRHVLYGASPMPEGILRKCMARLPGAEFIQGYGQTETAGICTLLGPEDHDPDGPCAHRLHSAGQPVVFCEVRIVDGDVRELPRGEVGEIAIRGSGNMLGYWKNPGETARTMKDGWILSGDVGFMDGDGYVYVVDRTKDMIISGGENVYSSETESVLSTHPDVLECAVIGVPDDRWGERVHAIVRLVPGTAADEPALIGFCKSRIASYKCPRSVEFRSSPLPLSASGKVLKRQLRAPYWEGRSSNLS